MFLLVPADLGSPGPKAVKRLCVCVLRFFDMHLFGQQSAVNFLLEHVCLTCSSRKKLL